MVRFLSSLEFDLGLDTSLESWVGLHTLETMAMKWIKALVGLAVIGGFLFFAMQIKEKKIDVPFISPPEAPVELKSGTEVPLVLLTPLDSGGSEVGKIVKFVVAQDVKSASGKVVIEQGAMATGTVKDSRTGTLMGSLTNKPARLSVELIDVVAANGKRLKIRDEALDRPFEFTQDNTNVDNNATVVNAISDPEARNLVANLARQIATGQEMSASDKSKADIQLQQLSEKYGLKDTQAFLKSDQKGQAKNGDVVGLLESVQKGDIKGLTGVDVLLAVRAAGELVDLGSGIDKTLRGIFKGSNIHARVGTPVTAILAENSKIIPKRMT